MASSSRVGGSRRSYRFPGPLREALVAAESSADVEYDIRTVDGRMEIVVRAGVPPGGRKPVADPLAAARARGAGLRRTLLDEQGPTLSAEEAGERLGISRQAVDKRRLTGRLVAVELGARGYRYPAWQFHDGDVLPGLPEVLAALGPRDAWSLLAFFGTPNEACGGASPRAVLEAGEVGRVLRAARAWTEQGAV